MHKYGLALVFLVLFQSFAFAQSSPPPGALSADIGVPIDLWSYDAAPDDKVKYDDVSISFGVSGKYFWNNNFGIFGNLDGTRLLQREFEHRGVKTEFPTKDLKTNIGLFISAGPAYRIPLGASAGLYIGVGPSYTLQVLESATYITAGVRTFLLTNTSLFHMLGVAVEPGIIVNFGKNFVFDAGVSLSFNLLRLQDVEVKIGGTNHTSERSVDQYFGVTISPHIGIGYSF